MGDRQRSRAIIAADDMHAQDGNDDCLAEDIVRCRVLTCRVQGGAKHASFGDEDSVPARW